MDAAPAPALGYAPDRAIRGRLTAIIIDGLLVGVLARLLLPALGAHTFTDVAVGFVILQFLYFFVQEAGGATTIGKGRAGLQVVQLNGSPATLRQIAIRNALRLFDSLPMFYASGLVAVMWSGPALRQRLGDKVAGTAVILRPGGKPHPTPGWLLPTLTVTAVLLSTVLYGLAYDEFRVPPVGENDLAPAAVPGFAGDNSQAPAAGMFNAAATFNGMPASDASGGGPLVRTWHIEKSCAAATPCTFTLTRTVAGVGEETGRLVPAIDGWHIDFPTRGFRVACPGRSGLTTVLRRASFVVHFDPGGASLQAHERTLYRSRDCGEFTVPLDWAASLLHL